MTFQSHVIEFSRVRSRSIVDLVLDFRLAEEEDAR